MGAWHLGVRAIAALAAAGSARRFPSVDGPVRRLAVAAVALLGPWVLTGSTASGGGSGSSVAAAGTAAPASGVLLFADSRGDVGRVGRGVPGLYVIGIGGATRKPLRGRFYQGATPDWSPDGRRIAFARWLDTEDARSSRWGLDLVIAKANGTAPRLVVGHSDRWSFPTAPEWSPDGRRIAFVNTGPTEPPQIFITDASAKHGLLNGGRRVSGSDGADSVSWSPSGDELVFGRDYPTGVYRISAKGGTRTLLIPKAHSPAWSPDGRQIAYLANRGGVYLLDLATRRSRFVTKACVKASAPEWSPDSHWLAFADCLHATATPPDPRALTIVRADGSGRRVVATGVTLSSPSWH